MEAKAKDHGRNKESPITSRKACTTWQFQPWFDSILERRPLPTGQTVDSSIMELFPSRPIPELSNAASLLANLLRSVLGGVLSSGRNGDQGRQTIWAATVFRKSRVRFCFAGVDPAEWESRVGGGRKHCQGKHVAPARWCSARKSDRSRLPFQPTSMATFKGTGRSRRRSCAMSYFG